MPEGQSPLCRLAFYIRYFYLRTTGYIYIRQGGTSKRIDLPKGGYAFVNCRRNGMLYAACAACILIGESTLKE